MQKHQKLIAATGAACASLLLYILISGILREPVAEKKNNEATVEDTKMNADDKTDDQAAEKQKTDSEEEGGSGTEAPRVALTFDDGPKIGSTERLLDGLKERDVKVTFFVIGKLAEQYPDIIKRIDAEGHLIGNHTYSHVDISRLDDETASKEITDTSEAIERIIGKPTEYVRPPFGTWQEELEQEMDVIPAMWTLDPKDWTTRNADEIVNKVVTKVKDGDIILLHDCYNSSVEATLRIIDLLQGEGYEFVTVDELIMN